MSDNIHIEIIGLPALQAKLSKLGANLDTEAVQPAMQEIAEIILDTKGIREYPGETAANKPPTPYYIRGKGMQYKSGNDGRSERLGSSFYTKKITMGVEVGNKASYARFVVGQQQAGALGRIGWRKLKDIAKEKIPQITAIVNAYIQRLIGKLGL